MTQLPGDQSVSETRELASQVLNAMAVASVVAGLTAFAVMSLMWLMSGQDNGVREWPALGWLVCGPAMAASVALVSAAESMRRPR